MGDGQRFRYPRSARLRRGPEIRSLLKMGSRRRCGPIEIFRGESTTASPRAGIIVPRYGHTIVERNQLKRRLREIVRTEWLPGSRREIPPSDLLVRVRPGAYELSVQGLREAFGRCAGAGG
ncbi:MAG: ribonuclease P protein component [Candidatus Palauibacterales bacterium]|nr:ribonuclease P protein component [Candidatus Palauibacterales bacterium]MDP2482021.1 ribonuclease P protein component [Candidatus Palauibacterales bacterium]